MLRLSTAKDSYANWVEMRCRAPFSYSLSNGLMRIVVYALDNVIYSV